MANTKAMKKVVSPLTMLLAAVIVEFKTSPAPRVKKLSPVSIILFQLNSSPLIQETISGLSRNMLVAHS